MATCPKCNARVDLGDDFCPDCGASIGESSAAKTEKSYKSGRSENIQCPRCGTELSGNARFCPKCGANQLVNCSKCGAKLGKTEKFCTGCGQRIIKYVSAAGKLAQLRHIFAFHGLDSCLRLAVYILLALLRLPALCAGSSKETSARKEVWQLQELFWVSSRCFLLSLR